MIRRLRIALVAATSIVLIGFAGGHALGSATKQVDGKFDVGGHKLYMHCVGSGSPTVVYLHGYLWDGRGGASNAGLIPVALSGSYRTCAYDRANLGQSDKVPGPITAKQTVTDLHRLLAAAHVDPPYVLLGASFGGLLSYIYAATYPGEVKGMVLLDAGFPTELPLEKYFPKKDRLTHDEWKQGAEKIDELGTYDLAYKLLPQQPKIPVTFLQAIPYTWSGPPAYLKAIPHALTDYVSGFSPGVIKRVQSPHYMEAAVPHRIVKEVELVAAKVSAKG